jgi:hypothetical protein
MAAAAARWMSAPAEPVDLADPNFAAAVQQLDDLARCGAGK